MTEYIEIICPICGRGMGRKAIARIPLYRGKTKGQVIRSEDYIGFMLSHYDFNKEIAIRRKTGKAGFKEFERLSWKDLDKKKQEDFKKLVLKAISFLYKKKILSKKDLQKIF